MMAKSASIIGVRQANLNKVVEEILLAHPERCSIYQNTLRFEHLDSELRKRRIKANNDRVTAALDNFKSRFQPKIEFANWETIYHAFDRFDTGRPFAIEMKLKLVGFVSKSSDGTPGNTKPTTKANTKKGKREQWEHLPMSDF